MAHPWPIYGPSVAQSIQADRKGAFVSCCGRKIRTGYYPPDDAAVVIGLCALNPKQSIVQLLDVMIEAGRGN
jgi:hypothetical protein